MRRKDREVNDFSKIKEIIADCVCCRLGLVDNKPVGVYTITPKGKKIFLEKGDKLTRDDLKALPEYIEMQVNKENENMVFVDNAHNRDFVEQVYEFSITPKCPHDDNVDALASTISARKWYDI